YLFGHGENSIYQIDRELRLLQDEGVGEKASIVPIIGDLKDADYMDYIIEKTRVDVIFHAAAYKHVPMTEENPVAAIENNFFGTINLVNAAKKNHVKRLVLITTDKAVEPVSIYGVSKKLCEEVVLDSNGGDTNFMVVRFGNVLGSRGSIVPLFRQQILKGGPVTVTSPEMRRYFMTIPEACSLVLKAGGVGKNGKLYLLDMGEPIRISDMAEQMIRFYGFEPNVDIQINYIGLRPGERVDESLWAEDERPMPTEYKRILHVERTCTKKIDLKELTDKLKPICFYDNAEKEKFRDSVLLRKVLKEIIPSLIVKDAA
ncbi:MAG: polysaccharide biosynthesis protein, partial [Spirochaetaceae bacterium]|nr:polysaccharide biosynthesis protein [Spirochaetaceae bacterium]